MAPSLELQSSLAQTERSAEAEWSLIVIILNLGRVKRKLYLARTIRVIFII